MEQTGQAGRNILAVVSGVVAGFVLILIVEGIGHLLYPPPEGLDYGDMEAVRAMTANLPAGALLMVAVAWAVGAFGGGWLAARIAKRSGTVHALIVGAVIELGAIANLLMLPHPVWFWVVGIVAILPAAYAGSRMASSPGSQRPRGGTLST